MAGKLDRGTLPSVKLFSVPPRLLRIPEAAHYIGATNWCVEELVRAGRLRFLVVGKYRVIDVRDLDDWIEVEKERQAGKRRFEIAA